MTEKGTINIVTESATKIAVSAASKGAMNIVTASATKFSVSVAAKGAVSIAKESGLLPAALLKGVEMIYNKYKERKWEKINKVLELEMEEDLQDLNNKIKALQEDFRKSEESTKNEIQIIRAELDKNPGNKAMGAVYVMLSVLERNIQELSEKIQNLEETVKEWPETTKDHLQKIRAELEKQGKEEEKIVMELNSKLKEKFQQLSQRLQTQEKAVKEWSETTKDHLQKIRGDLENRGKEMEIARAQQCTMETLLPQLLQRIQTLEQVFELRQESPHHEFQLFRAYLENDQGIAMQREEIIHLRVLELAREERTDSRSAFGRGPAQGAVWNRRLHEARGFFRSVSGGEVKQITPGASDNLHANQDQRTTCLDSLFRSIAGIQRSMDIRVWTNNLQVLMLILGVLISIIILARIFTLPWP